MTTPSEIESVKLTNPWGGCASTHGGAGYASGTKVDRNGDIICGLCKEVIGNINDGVPRVRLPEWIRFEKDD